MPAYRILPTEISVDSVVYEIRKIHEMLHVKRAQIAVQIIEYDAAFIGLKTQPSRRMFYEIELEFMKKLRAYSKRIQGSLLTIGPGRYMIFSTRGFCKISPITLHM